MIEITDHIPLVKSIAGKLCRYLPATLDRDDLIQEGTVALVECFARYDPARGTFSTFATLYIRGAMLDIIQKQDWVPRLERQRKPGGLKRIVSMNAPNENGTTIADDLADEDRTSKRSAHRDEIKHKLRNVNESDRRFLWAYYSESRTFSEIGKQLGVTRQRAQQQHARIMQKLRG